jgi:hypothetical protein
MSDKSYVSMEQHLCVVCGHPYDTHAILLDRRLRDSMERHTITGWGMCEEHEKLKQEGYVALVACDDENVQEAQWNGHVFPQDAHRTGAIAHVRLEAFNKMFSTPAPEGMVCFTDNEIIEYLQTLEEESHGHA